MLPFLSSCAQIDAVGDKVDELKNMRKESSTSAEDFRLNEVLGSFDVDQAKESAREQKVSGIPDVCFYIDGIMGDRFFA